MTFNLILAGDRQRRRGQAALAIILAASLFAVCSVLAAQDRTQAPSAVRVSKASRESVSAIMKATGTVVSRNDARIAAEIAGRLTWIAEPGTIISRGQMLAHVDDSALKLKLRENEANIARLEANAKYLQSQVARFERLVAQNIASHAQLDEVAAQRDMIAEEINQARVVRDQTLHTLSRARVAAPFSGQVVERLHEAGEFVGTGGELVRLVDTREVEVRAQAPIETAEFVSSGHEVRVVGRADRVARGSVRAVIPVGNERSRQIEVRVSLPDGAWPIGAPVIVELPTSAPSVVVVVPRDAIVLRQKATYVLRVTPSSTVERIPVRTGVGFGGLIEVEGEVKAGDRVVVRGGERLQPGQVVSVVAET